MNILVDMHVFDGKHQGTRTYLKGLYTELIPIAKNHHFFLVANDVKNLKSEFKNYNNVSYISLKSNNKFYRLLFEFPSIIKQNKIDFAHFQYIAPPFKNCKLIITIHDILFEQKEYKKYFSFKYRIVNGALFRWSASRANILLTVSEYSKRKISEIYNINLEKIKITPNAVNPIYNQTNVNSVPRNNHLGKYLLYVSRVEPRKNHLNLLRAFIQLGLVEKGYKMVFIGNKDILFNDLKQFINQMDSRSKASIIWLEKVSSSELNSYYQNCALFVFPSFAEGFGIPPLEAMALGKRVLCSNQTAMNDFDLPENFRFDPYNIEELKRKITVQLSSNFDLAEVYKPILAKYNWQEIAKEFKQVVDFQNKQTT